MKYLLFTLCILVFFTNTPSYSQENKQNKLESYKIAFITQKLDLTPKEAQDFWPLYNQYQKEIKLLHAQSKKLRINIRKNGGFDSLTAKDAEKLLNQFINIETDIQQKKIRLFKDLKPILPTKKILKLHRAEQDFNRRILERLKKRRDNFRKRN